LLLAGFRAKARLARWRQTLARQLQSLLQDNGVHIRIKRGLWAPFFLTWSLT